MRTSLALAALALSGCGLLLGSSLTRNISTACQGTDNRSGAVACSTAQPALYQRCVDQLTAATKGRTDACALCLVNTTDVLPSDQRDACLATVASVDDCTSACP